MGPLSHHLYGIATSFLNETPADDVAPADAAEAADPSAVADQGEDAGVNQGFEGIVPAQVAKLKADMQGEVNIPQKMEELFGKAPVVDKGKLDLNGMSSLRLAAFEGENADAARTWAANLAELKKQCFVDSGVEPCKVLATESMFMAAKYYQMWDESMSMWDSQGNVDADGIGGNVDMEGLGGEEHAHDNLGGAEDADAAAAGVSAGDAGAEQAPAIDSEALQVAQASMGAGLAVGASLFMTFLDNNKSGVAGRAKKAREFL
ncbi:unnamed protein product [Amoebophrya sp. A120]|nr:unnamed protein product [Amoebophrya sp. A120]|eukprot:GSA120T00004857001.1